MDDRAVTVDAPWHWERTGSSAEAPRAPHIHPDRRARRRSEQVQERNYVVRIAERPRTVYSRRLRSAAANLLLELPRLPFILPSPVTHFIEGGAKKVSKTVL